MLASNMEVRAEDTIWKSEGIPTKTETAVRRILASTVNANVVQPGNRATQIVWHLHTTSSTLGILASCGGGQHHPSRRLEALSFCRHSYVLETPGFLSGRVIRSRST